VLCFARLAHRLGTEQPFYAFQDTGEVNASVPAMAARYVAAMRAVQPRGPYLLGGYSLGGTIAFEMARQIDASGETLGLLAILDHAPFASQYRRVTVRTRVVLTLAQQLTEYARVVGALSPDQRASHVREHLRRLVDRLQHVTSGRRSVSSDADRFDDFVARQYRVLSLLPLPEQGRVRRIVEREYAALANYAPRPFRGSITLFRARAQPFGSTTDRTMGWQSLAARGVTVREVPGLHAYILKEPFVRELALQLQSALGAATHANTV
jgi:thioesterase domain-containing protein